MKTKIVMGVLGLFSLVFTSLATANTVSFVEGTNLLTGGASPITLTLQGDFDVNGVSAGDMIISWAPAVLDLTGAAAEAGWTIFTETIFPGTGQSSLGFTAVWDGTSDNSGLAQQFATFTFNVIGAIGAFSDVVTISDNADLGNGFAGWSGTDGENLPTNYIDIQVEVSAVPIPAAAWLFASGLLGMVGVARRRQTRAA